SELLLEDAEDEGYAFAGELQTLQATGKELLKLVNEKLDQGKLEAQEIVNLAELSCDIRQALSPAIDAAAAGSEQLIETATQAGLEEVVSDLRRINTAATRLVGLIDDITASESNDDVRSPEGESDASEMAREAMASIRAGAPDQAKGNAVEGTLLVVDDNESNRDLLSRQLIRRGHTVAVAENGLEALQIVQQRPFDLILLDVMMPQMNGYEVLQRLKADSELQHVPVIMISALDQMASVVRCIEAGAEDYLPKPFNSVLLHARIGAALHKKKLHDIEQAYLGRLQAEWEKSQRLEDNLRQVVRFSLQKAPEEMLAASLDILIALTGAQVGAILEEDGPTLSFLCTSTPTITGSSVPWDSVAGETAEQGVIVYTHASTELTHYASVSEPGLDRTNFLLSVPIPRIVATKQNQAGNRSSGVLQLLFEDNAFPGTTVDQKTSTRLGMDLSGEVDADDRLLQELFMILPTISLGMEIQKLRQTSYQAIHELKNKLLAAQSWTHCLKEDLEEVAPEALENEDIQEDIKLAVEAAQSGSKLAVSYLQFTKIYNPQFEPCQLNDVLKETATDIQAFADTTAGKRRVTVTVELNDGIPVRDLDPGHLKMAFFNIAKNAAEALLEHDVREPEIRLASACEDGRITVTLSDNGNGMPPEIAENLFVPFTTKKEGGTGLGLTITKKIVDMHNGTIRCTSSPTGTEFQVCL
ncbi:MAG: response regulator, partial [Lentisphaerae bacterium]|nr:response regulator [Lentisphaerota bacterium]